MKKFTEVICICEGKMQHLSYHKARIEHTYYTQFHRMPPQNFLPTIIPENAKTGLIKCRLVYNEELLEITYTPYQFKPRKKVAWVEDNSIYYAYKFEDRSCFNRWIERAPSFDDIIIVQDGLITDSCFANIVCVNKSGFFTPSRPLLRGTCRERLLAQNILTPCDIPISEIHNYDSIIFINAMMGIEDNINCLPSQIYPL